MKHKDFLYAQLADDDYAVGYLEAALEEDDPRVFFLALNDVIEARGINKSKLAKSSGLSRNGLYTALDKEANPQFESIRNIIRAAGYKLSITKPSDTHDQERSLV